MILEISVVFQHKPLSKSLFFSSSLSECYFAGKCTALMLGSNEKLQPCDGRRFSQISNELSTSQSSIGSSIDIQQHLQSMFYLLRPEETLKMVRINIFTAYIRRRTWRDQKCLKLKSRSVESTADNFLNGATIARKKFFRCNRCLKSPVFKENVRRVNVWACVSPSFTRSGALPIREKF